MSTPDKVLQIVHNSKIKIHITNGYTVIHQWNSSRLEKYIFETFSKLEKVNLYMNILEYI